MPPVCYQFLHKQCPLTASTCPLSHNKDDAPLCMYWKKGPCPSGNWCVNRHYYLEKDSWRRVHNVQQGRGASKDDMEFNSPLVVKVKNVVEEHRRVEVDLETGRRRSWVEVENKELIDITGEDSPVPAPVKKLDVKKDKGAKKKINLEEERGKEDEVVVVGKSTLKETYVSMERLKTSKKDVDKSSKDNTKNIDDKNRNKSTRRKVTTALEKTNESNEISSADKENENEKAKSGSDNCSVCGRSFKGAKGLQMHLARSTCGK